VGKSGKKPAGGSNQGTSWLGKMISSVAALVSDNPVFVEIKVRIPELHSHIAEPSALDDGSHTPGPHQPIIDMHDTFIAQTDTLEEPKPGDLVWVDYTDKHNWSGPIYVSMVNSTEPAVHTQGGPGGPGGAGNNFDNGDCVDGTLKKNNNSSNALAGVNANPTHVGVSLQPRGTHAKAIIMGDSQAKGAIGAYFKKFAKDLGYTNVVRKGSRYRQTYKKLKKKVGKAEAAKQSLQEQIQRGVTCWGGKDVTFFATGHGWTMIKKHLTRNVGLVMITLGGNGPKASLAGKHAALLCTKIKRLCPSATIIFSGCPPCVRVGLWKGGYARSYPSRSKRILRYLKKNPDAGWDKMSVLINPKSPWYKNGSRRARNKSIRKNLVSMASQNVYYVEPFELMKGYPTASKTAYDGTHAPLWAAKILVDNIARLMLGKIKQGTSTLPKQAGGVKSLKPQKLPPPKVENPANLQVNAALLTYIEEFNKVSGLIEAIWSTEFLDKKITDTYGSIFDTPPKGVLGQQQPAGLGGTPALELLKTESMMNFTKNDKKKPTNDSIAWPNYIVHEIALVHKAAMTNIFGAGVSVKDVAAQKAKYEKLKAALLELVQKQPEKKAEAEKAEKIRLFFETVEKQPKHLEWIKNKGAKLSQEEKTAADKAAAEKAAKEKEKADKAMKKLEDTLAQAQEQLGMVDKEIKKYGWPLKKGHPPDDKTITNLFLSTQASGIPSAAPPDKPWPPDSEGAMTADAAKAKAKLLSTAKKKWTKRIKEIEEKIKAATPPIAPVDDPCHPGSTGFVDYGNLGSGFKYPAGTRRKTYVPAAEDAIAKACKFYEKHYPYPYEEFVAHVKTMAYIESHGTVNCINAGGYSGLWQFNNRSWVGYRKYKGAPSSPHHSVLFIRDIKHALNPYVQAFRTAHTMCKKIRLAQRLIGKGHAFTPLIMYLFHQQGGGGCRNVLCRYRHKLNYAQNLGHAANMKKGLYVGGGKWGSKGGKCKRCAKYGGKWPKHYRKNGKKYTRRRIKARDCKCAAFLLHVKDAAGNLVPDGCWIGFPDLNYAMGNCGSKKRQPCVRIRCGCHPRAFMANYFGRWKGWVRAGNANRPKSPRGGWKYNSIKRDRAIAMFGYKCPKKGSRKCWNKKGKANSMNCCGQRKVENSKVPYTLMYPPAQAVQKGLASPRMAKPYWNEWTLVRGHVGASAAKLHPNAK